MNSFCAVLDCFSIADSFISISTNCIVYAAGVVKCQAQALFYVFMFSFILLSLSLALLYSWNI